MRGGYGVRASDRRLYRKYPGLPRTTCSVRHPAATEKGEFQGGEGVIRLLTRFRGSFRIVTLRRRLRVCQEHAIARPIWVGLDWIDRTHWGNS